jgi:hypothetical protein
MQIEIRLVLFQPSAGHYAVDVYRKVDRVEERVYCGGGWQTQEAAVVEAIQWLMDQNRASASLFRL